MGEGEEEREGKWRKDRNRIESGKPGITGNRYWKRRSRRESYERAIDGGGGEGEGERHIGVFDHSLFVNDMSMLAQGNI